MNNFSFDILNSQDFYNKLIEEFEEYKSSDNSSRHALNCAMTSWHLTEWIYHEYEFNQKFPKLKDFQKHCKDQCPSLQIMHDISNGSKHYKLERHNPKVQSTKKHQGPFDNSFDFSFDRTMLQIGMENGELLVFDLELEKTIAFWTKFLNEL